MPGFIDECRDLIRSHSAGTALLEESAIAFASQLESPTAGRARSPLRSSDTDRNARCLEE